MPANFVGISSSSVVGRTSKFNNEYSSNYNSSTTTASFIYRLEPGINEDMYCVLYDKEKTGSTITERWSYFKTDTQSGGISWQKYFTSPDTGGIKIRYAYGTLTGGAFWERLFVQKGFTSVLCAVDPQTGDIVHSININTTTGGNPAIMSVEYRSNSTTGADVYIGGNYLNSSNGQEGFISKLVYDTSTGFTLSWTVSISGPVAAVDEVCQVESICAPYDGSANVFCGGYVRTATSTYRPFLLALNPSTGAMVWERTWTTHDNSYPTAITSIVADTAPATPKLICGGTLYSYNSTLATPTIIAISSSGNGSSLLSKCIVPATSMSGYSGETKIYSRNSMGTPVLNTSFYKVGNAAIGSSSSDFSQGFFNLTSSFNGTDEHSLDASDYYNLRNSEYSLPGFTGIDTYGGLAEYDSDVFVGGGVYKKLSPSIDGVSFNSLGFLIKNVGAAVGSPFTFRGSGAQISYASVSPTWASTTSGFTNSAASTNLNQASVTFSISTYTPSIATYSIPRTSSVKTEEYPSMFFPI